MQVCAPSFVRLHVCTYMCVQADLALIRARMIKWEAAEGRAGAG